MFKAAIFDLDGTIAYTLPDLAEGLTRAHEKYGLPPVTEEQVLKFVNGTTDEFIRACFPAGQSREYYAEALNTYLCEYSKCCLHNTRAYDGINEALLILRENNIKLAVLTNKDDSSAKGIVEKLFPGIFDIIIGHGRFPGKPDPQSTLYIADFFGAKPEEVAYFGDSDVDMMTSERAGTYTCGVTWGYRGADILEKTGARVLLGNPEKIIDVILNK